MPDSSRGRQAAAVAEIVGAALAPVVEGWTTGRIHDPRWSRPAGAVTETGRATPGRCCGRTSLPLPRSKGTRTNYCGWVDYGDPDDAGNYYFALTDVSHGTFISVNYVKVGW